MEGRREEEKERLQTFMRLSESMSEPSAVRNRCVDTMSDTHTCVDVRFELVEDLLDGLHVRL